MFLLKIIIAYGLLRCNENSKNNNSEFLGSFFTQIHSASETECAYNLQPRSTGAVSLLRTSVIFATHSQPHCPLGTLLYYRNLTAFIQPHCIHPASLHSPNLCIHPTSLH